ncbi:MAG: hypothetical protein GC145_17670 [Caulobacter sp.]|nr:hypothetical protein [Caulobacter sp.]
MRKPLLIASLVFGALTLGGTAGAAGSSLHPSTRVICLDVGGELRPATCRTSASRLDQSDSICICKNAQRVEAPVCDRGEKPVSENRTYELARKEAARDGSLVGDLFQGRRMCVRARNS